MRICVVAPPEKCLRVKADMVLFAGNTVWFISERIRGICEDTLYKSMLSLPLPSVIRKKSLQAKDPTISSFAFLL